MTGDEDHERCPRPAVPRDVDPAERQHDADQRERQRDPRPAAGQAGREPQRQDRHDDRVGVDEDAGQRRRHGLEARVVRRRHCRCRAPRAPARPRSCRRDNRAERPAPSRPTPRPTARPARPRSRTASRAGSASPDPGVVDRGGEDRSGPELGRRPTPARSRGASTIHRGREATTGRSRRRPRSRAPSQVAGCRPAAATAPSRPVRRGDGLHSSRDRPHRRRGRPSRPSADRGAPARPQPPPARDGAAGRPRWRNACAPIQRTGTGDSVFVCDRRAPRRAS